MKKHIVFIVCILLLTTSVSYSQQTKGNRERINFDFNWKFHLGHAANAEKDFDYTIHTIFNKAGQSIGTAIAPDFNDSLWSAVQLPHDWIVNLPFDKHAEKDHGYKPVGGAFPQNSVGWYRKSFKISRSDSGKRFVIQFDGVYRDSKFWLNGIYLGNNMGGYNSFSFDITDNLNFEEKNVLVVRADASQFEGWFYEGAGIYRHAWLNKLDNIHIAENGLFAHAVVKANAAEVNVETAVENKNGYSSDCSVVSYITSREGEKLATSAETSVVLGINEKKLIQQQIIVANERLWKLEDPYLYRLITVIKSGNKIVDQVSTKLGIRTIVMDKDKGIFLNGKYIKIQGVCCHQDHGGIGSALPDHLQFYRVGLLKEMGVNAYRTSHNPPAPELLDACDSLGMLVLDETRMLNSGKEYLDQFEKMILRDRNHPSIFMWSIGNEETIIQENSIGKRMAQTMILLQQKLDPTRPSTYAANLGNIFNGVNEVIPVRGFNYNLYGVDPYRLAHPDQPIFGSEVGSTVSTRGVYSKDTVSAWLPDQDITYPSWASKAEQWWPFAAERSWFLGGFVWTGFDYRGEPTPFQWPNINSHFGIMDMCGFPKNIYYYYQSWWAKKDILHISPHWNWKGKEGRSIEVWVNSNAETVELFLNKKSLGKKEMPRNGHLNWMVDYKPGILKAVAYKNDKKIIASSETTDVPYQLVITADRNKMLADGQDATVLNITVVDKKGLEVPDAGNLVKFSLDGEAKIIGVGNGDPSSHEPDQYNNQQDYQRHLFNGKCQVIFRAGTHAGTINIKAEAKEIKGASVEIQLSGRFDLVKEDYLNN